MSKALLGSHADTRTLALLDEVRHLRARVAELEAELARAEAAAEKLDVVEVTTEPVLEASGA